MLVLWQTFCKDKTRAKNKYFIMILTDRQLVLIGAVDFHRSIGLIYSLRQKSNKKNSKKSKKNSEPFLSNISISKMDTNSLLRKKCFGLK